jgi:hypothetical protein
MKTQNTPNPMLARSPEPFEEVWMFPEGWDLSEMADKPVQNASPEAESVPAERLFFVTPSLSR